MEENEKQRVRDKQAAIKELENAEKTVFKTLQKIRRIKRLAKNAEDVRLDGWPVSTGWDIRIGSKSVKINLW